MNDVFILIRIHHHKSYQQVFVPTVVPRLGRCIPRPKESCVMLVINSGGMLYSVLTSLYIEFCCLLILYCYQHLWCRGYHACLSSWETWVQGLKIVEEKKLPLLYIDISKWLDVRVFSDKDVKIVGTLDPLSTGRVRSGLWNPWKSLNLNAGL
jgi:hypothetical protein